MFKWLLVSTLGLSGFAHNYFAITEVRGSQCNLFSGHWVWPFHMIAAFLFIYAAVDVAMKD